MSPTIFSVNMPKHFEYVFAAYGIWFGTFAVYLAYLWHRSRRVRASLLRMDTSRTHSE